MTEIDDRAAQLGSKLGEPLTDEVELPGGIHYRCYYNAVLWDYPQAGVYVHAEATVAHLFQSSAPSVPPPPDTTTLVEGIDAASYQSVDLTPLLTSLEPHPSHVIVRLYQEIESPPQSHSSAQIQSAWGNGCTVGGYVWIYRDVNGADSVDSALDLADSVGLVVPVLWLDLETYTDGSYPSIDNVQAAVDACRERGVQPGVYSGEWFWVDYMNNTTQFSDLPLWHAAYGKKPEKLRPVSYGGWGVPAVQQWTSSPCDRNVLDYAVTVPPP